MGETTGIQWTQHTWNPWQGCQKVSPGCENCYMFRDKARYGQNPELVVRSAPQTFNAPLRWQRAAARAGETHLVFVASWADFFSREADGWRAEAWEIIKRCPNLVFQVLTKRHARLARCLPDDWGTDGYPNVWLGVSAEDRTWFIRRVAALREVSARVRFVSYEPAIGGLVNVHGGVSLVDIDWLIVGGESGSGVRPFDLQWAREAIELGKRDGCAVFVKQLGARAYGDHGEVKLGTHLAPATDGRRYRFTTRDSHGGDWSEWPEDLRVREFPRGWRIGTPGAPIPFKLEEVLS